MPANYLETILANLNISISEWLEIENDKIANEILELAFEKFVNDLDLTIDAMLT